MQGPMETDIRAGRALGSRSWPPGSAPGSARSSQKARGRKHAWPGCRIKKRWTRADCDSRVSAPVLWSKDSAPYMFKLGPRGLCYCGRAAIRVPERLAEPLRAPPNRRLSANTPPWQQIKSRVLLRTPCCLASVRLRTEAKGTVSGGADPNEYGLHGRTPPSRDLAPCSPIDDGCVEMLTEARWVRISTCRPKQREELRAYFFV